MKEFSVEEVIKFSQQIEEESYNFYKEANRRFEDEALKKLTDDLAKSEIDHLNKLRGLLEETRLSAEDLQQRITLEDTGYDKIVQAEKILDDATPRDVLKIALGREKNTATTYKMLNTITDLSSEVINIFSYLTNQEEGHVRIIENMLKRL